MPRIKVQPKTETQLVEASEHVIFEMSLFNYCVHRLTFDHTVGQDGFLYNTLVSGFPIHARNIIEFLYGEMDSKGTMAKDDICAFQFFDDLNFWHTITPSKTPYFEDLKTDIDKRSAHLSYWRVQHPNHWWTWVGVHQEIKPLIGLFISHVSPKRIHGDMLTEWHSWAWSNIENLPKITS
jgi:hypothetical protein